MPRNNEQARARYAVLKAKDLCVHCGKGKPEIGKVRCSECLKSNKGSAQRRKARYTRTMRFLGMTPEALYKAVKSEREVVSWCWKNPA